MLSKTYEKKPLKPFKLNKRKCTKGIRNFLCDWLYHDGMVLSYAPSAEFATRSIFQLYLGGWVVEFNPEIERYCPVKPLCKVNYRSIRELYEMGFLEARFDLKRPHERFIFFSWTKEAIANRREIMREVVIGEDGIVTTVKLDLLANLYGLKVVHSKAFEICKANGEHIPKGKATRTWIFANAAGEPVSKLNDMPILEWEDALYHVAKRLGTLGRLGPVPDGSPGHFSRLKAK